MSITLPPLPVILARVSKAEHDTLERQFRARDLEVARVVLEAAAKEVHGCAHRIMADLLDVDSHRRVLATEQRIRELEVSHDA